MARVRVIKAKVNARKTAPPPLAAPPIAPATAAGPAAAHVKTDEVFAALVGNGLDFFERSAGELAKEQKFAIAHFATGLELILKARLFHEHWTLIAANPHGCAWTSVKDGTAVTIAASELCATITTTVGTPLKHQERAFNAVFAHRNRVLHWSPSGDLAATVAEQCLAWHHLRELLTGPWSSVFTAFRTRIDDIEAALRGHHTYLDTIFKQLERKLGGLESAGRVLDCPACGFRAGVVVDDETQRVRDFECLVCAYGAAAACFPCDTIYALDQLPIEDCACGHHHTASALVDELDPAFGQREELDRGRCGECSGCEPTVAPDGLDYVCVTCGMRFDAEEAASCEYCNERWYGWNAAGRFMLGCGCCDGRGYERD